MFTRCWGSLKKVTLMLKNTLVLKVYSLLFALMFIFSLLQFSAWLSVHNFLACEKKASNCIHPSHLLCIFLKSKVLLKKQNLLAGCPKKMYFFPRSCCSVHGMDIAYPGCHAALENPAGHCPTSGPLFAGVKVLGSPGAPGWLTSLARSEASASRRSRRARTRRAESGG